MSDRLSARPGDGTAEGTTGIDFIDFEPTPAAPHDGADLLDRAAVHGADDTAPFVVDVGPWVREPPLAHPREDDSSLSGPETSGPAHPFPPPLPPLTPLLPLTPAASFAAPRARPKGPKAPPSAVLPAPQPPWGRAAAARRALISDPSPVTPPDAPAPSPAASRPDAGGFDAAAVPLPFAVPVPRFVCAFLAQPHEIPIPFSDDADLLAPQAEP